MMESKEIKDLRGRILGMEMELNMLSKDLERFKYEYDYNSKMLEKIEENLDFLRNSSAAVSLSEFKNIRQQKHLIEMRVRYYRDKAQPLEQMVDRKESYHKEEMEKFEKIYRMQFENNILEFPGDRRKKTKN